MRVVRGMMIGAFIKAVILNWWIGTVNPIIVNRLFSYTG